MLSYLGWKRAQKKDIQQSTKDNVVISTKLDMVLNSISNVETKLSAHDRNFTELEIKVTEALASGSSAHKRIDELISKGGY
jgi:hypothetical protein